MARALPLEADALSYGLKLVGSALVRTRTVSSLHALKAHAEYMSTNNASRLIPEQRIVDVWNVYVREIGAPNEAIVTAAEIHNMRDAEFVLAQRMWERGIQTVWTIAKHIRSWPQWPSCRGLPSDRDRARDPRS